MRTVLVVGGGAAEKGERGRGEEEEGRRGGGSDGAVNERTLSITHHGMHRIMGSRLCGQTFTSPVPVHRAPKRLHRIQAVSTDNWAYMSLVLDRDGCTATAALHSFLHVDTGQLSSTTTGMTTFLSEKGHGVLCHCRQQACTLT